MKTKHTVPFEIKAVDDTGTFCGYGSVFGVQDYDGDVIVKGAFSNTLKKAQQTGRMPKMLWQHQVDTIIGKFNRMVEDERGLYVEGELLLEIDKGREAYALMKAGVLDGMSIGFNIVDGSRETRGRMITEVDLWEVSLVTWGANPEALITNVKSSIREFEAFLRESGFSRKEALAIAASGYKAIAQRDSADDTLDRLKELTQTIMESKS